MTPRRLLQILAAAAAASCAAALHASAVPAYRGAIAVDAATGEVLFENNADEMGPPASMAKLMTFAVLDDEIRGGTLSLSTPVTITAEDARVAAMKDSTEVWLRQGETFPVEELVYAMMIQSANDAAYALAHKAGGTVQAFVARMNAKAREIGMTRSTFRSPNGYPPPSRRVAEGDLTTPRDFAILCRYLVLHTDILRYTAVRSRTFGAGIRLKPVLMANHNHLLGRIAGVDGLKTGFSSAAGFCISTTAERNGHRVVAVVMDSPDQRTRDLNTMKILNQAFIRLPITEGPFSQAPSERALPAAPTRPSAAAPSPSPSPDAGPVIHLPGSPGA
jgi:D-alanyl-D-alanine carboxypeptidase (penicillin-binding protein 5/6)